MEPILTNLSPQWKIVPFTAGNVFLNQIRKICGEDDSIPHFVGMTAAIGVQILINSSKNVRDFCRITDDCWYRGYHVISAITTLTFGYANAVGIATIVNEPEAATISAIAGIGIYALGCLFRRYYNQPQNYSGEMHEVLRMGMFISTAVPLGLAVHAGLNKGYAVLTGFITGIFIATIVEGTRLVSCGNNWSLVSLYKFSLPFILVSALVSVIATRYFYA